MAIELNMRTKILAGVVVLAAAGAGAWFFLLQDEPPPPPPATAAKPPAKPVAESAKGAPADAPKLAADAAKPAAAAPAGPKPPAKPVPTEPAKVVAEILETSGIKALIQAYGAVVKSGKDRIKDPAGLKDLNAIEQRLFEPVGMLAEVSLTLTKAYDANRMPRFLQMLREPAVQKIVALNIQLVALPEKDTKELIEKVDKTAPAEARAKLIARIEEVNRPTAFDADVDGAVARAQVEGMLEYLQTDKKANFALTELGDGNPRNARPAMLAKIDGKRGERIRGALKRYSAALRDVSDADLADYLKLVDTEIGEWGATTLAGVLNAAVTKRTQEHARGFAKVLYGAKPEMAKAPAKDKSAAEAPAEKLAAAAAKAPAAPKEPPAYQRPANIREVYTRYNDLVTATVMRDRVAVKELLDDGKRPNVRQTDGTTPLMIAAGNGDADLVQMLLAKGADPNLRAAGGATALSIAKERRRADVVQLLERHGAKN